MGGFSWIKINQRAFSVTPKCFQKFASLSVCLSSFRSKRCMTKKGNRFHSSCEADARSVFLAKWSSFRQTVDCIFSLRSNCRPVEGPSWKFLLKLESKFRNMRRLSMLVACAIVLRFLSTTFLFEYFSSLATVRSLIVANWPCFSMSYGSPFIGIQMVQCMRLTAQKRSIGPIRRMMKGWWHMRW